MERGSYAQSLQVIHVGMNAVPVIGALARHAETAVPYVSIALKTVPLLARDYGLFCNKLDESVEIVSIGQKAAPYIAATASSIAQTVDNALPFGFFGDLSTSSRYVAAEKV